ncbi:MAG: glutamine-hydrolyzing carbamoyl-phosphate synthase small subunit [Pseudomonadota bacterium]
MTVVNQATRPSETRQPSPYHNAILAFADGTVIWGHGAGARGEAVGEVCFNTAMTGYQEIITDPSYAGQIITFTFPHIGNVGANHEDHEALAPAAPGIILREAISVPSNFRSEDHLSAWLTEQNVIAITGVDTRRLTRNLRENGAANAVIAHWDAAKEPPEIEPLIARAKSWQGLEGTDLAPEVTTDQQHDWSTGSWSLGNGYRENDAPTGAPHIVAIDYGMKRNILRYLADAGARLTVVPAETSADTIISLDPDGIFLSNGPGDPAATAAYAVPTIKALLETGLPMFGICLGHQLLALALGGRTVKMHQGHHGANHPVFVDTDNRVEITSMNHGFTVDAESFAGNDRVAVTHRSLFDQTICGLELTDAPVFSVQHHPEASPGPRDASYLFARFLNNVTEPRKTA